MRSRRAGGSGGSSRLAKEVEAAKIAVATGKLTLKQVRTDQIEVWVRAHRDLRALRQDYLLYQSPPRTRMNTYIEGSSGSGKTLLGKMFAAALFRDLDPEECYHEAGDPKVAVQTYGAQPLVLWDDYRPGDLISACGGRAGVWRVFDPYPGGAEVNIKNSSVRMLQSVNIITGIVPFQKFAMGLAGKYVDQHRQWHEAEDVTQAFRRLHARFDRWDEVVARMGDDHVAWLDHRSGYPAHEYYGEAS